MVLRTSGIKLNEFLENITVLKKKTFIFLLKMRSTASQGLDLIMGHHLISLKF